MLFSLTVTLQYTVLGAGGVIKLQENVIPSFTAAPRDVRGLRGTATRRIVGAAAGKQETLTTTMWGYLPVTCK